MVIKTCEEYVLCELEDTKNELEEARIQNITLLNKLDKVEREKNIAVYLLSKYTKLCPRTDGDDNFYNLSGYIFSDEDDYNLFKEILEENEDCEVKE